MGEFAKYNGREIKIGTCESMYYLRASQAPLVSPVPNSLDPNGPEREEIRFRFPFPDEDQIEPGAFGDFDRGVLVPGMVERCDKCAADTAVDLNQQKHVDGRLVIVVRCAACHTAWRLPTLAEARPVFDAFAAEAKRASDASQHERAIFCAEIAKRILDGYTTPQPPPAPRLRLVKAAPPPAPEPTRPVGSKYEATKAMRTVEIAALIRADLKAEVAAGRLPKGLKVSVVYKSYSGGCSITATIKATGGIAVMHPDRLAQELDAPHAPPTGTWISPAAAALEAQVEALLNAYNFDWSDPQSDYFNNRFYAFVNFDSALTRAERAAFAANRAGGDEAARAEVARLREENAQLKKRLALWPVRKVEVKS